MEEKKKRRGVEIEEVPEDDVAESNIPHGGPQKQHRENKSGDCDCSCCPKHSSRKRKRTPMPCGHMRGGRNLVICIDGTANQFGEKNTNVIEIYNLILKEMQDHQHTWYNSGIGTYARPHWRSPKYWEQIVVHKIDLAIAWNFELTLQAAYRWLADNYEEGDCIFLFGFSRGAFQVRALAGMIHKVGLIHKGNEVQIPFAYQLYADPKSDNETADQVGSTDTKVSMAQRFKEAFSRTNVKVHFVGAWDTVSSIGVARGKRMLPKTTEGMTHVCYFRQALALDERRVKFLPEYAWGGTTLPPPQQGESEVKDKSSDSSHGNRVHPQVMEVWFPGTHSDIGGGNAINAGMDRSRPPLRWMASQAAVLGLRIKPFKRDLKSSEQIEFRESLTGLWHIFEMFPFQRLTFARRLPGISTTRMPHLWSPRKIHDGQKIHFSLVLGQKERPYTPKARPNSSDPLFWTTLLNEPLRNSTKLLEIDMFYHGADAVSKILANEPVDDVLNQIFKDETGPQFFYDEVIETIRSWKGATGLDLNAQCRLLRRTGEILQGKSGSIQLRKWSGVGTPLVEVLKSGSDEDRKVVETFQSQYTNGEDVNCLYELRGHSLPVRSVAISPNGKRIVSGSWDNTIRIWDMEKGEQVGEPLRGHDGTIICVAILPNSKLIVSGSDDQTIRIWDAETGMQVGESLQGHKGWVRSVACSHDGKRIVSGSNDNTIRIWDAEKGTQVGAPLQGHTAMLTIAISPDDRHIVCGGGSSRDHTIRIWNAETKTQVEEPLQGHTDWVWSVAISPDGMHIVSGSTDNTIRIWDAETQTQVGEPLRGHSGTVRSVAISPDGKHIVSGSDDETIRIWHLETREQVGEPLRGHTDWVWYVAISPDGKRIVSGSRDMTVRIWNAEGILV